MTDRLSGRAALVTGASSGIGEAIALALAREGAAVALTARRAARLEALAGRIAEAGSTAVALPGDITDADVAIGIVEAAAARLGRLDILVNAAGIMPEDGVATGDLARWRQVIELNLLAGLYTCQAAAAVMRRQGGGDIVNISSVAGRRATALFAAYSTSKFGLGAMSEALRQEIGGAGIRVCLIEPGAVNTGLWESIADPSLRRAVQDRAERPGALSAEDVASAVLFALTLPPHANVSELLLRPTSDVAPL